MPGFLPFVIPEKAVGGGEGLLQRLAAFHTNRFFTGYLRLSQFLASLNIRAGLFSFRQFLMQLQKLPAKLVQLLFAGGIRRFTFG